MIEITFSKLLKSVSLLALAAPLFAQSPAATPSQAPKPKPEDTEYWEPIPAVVTPGVTLGAPPSDAIVLFDGSNEDEWTTIGGKAPAGWVVGNGILTVDKSKGGIETKRKFKNYQLHLEWCVPSTITGTGQARGKFEQTPGRKRPSSVPNCTYPHAPPPWGV